MSCTTHNTREINAWGVLAYYWCIKACVDVLDHSHSHGINARGMLTPPPPCADVSWHAKIFQTPLPQGIGASGMVATHWCGMCC